MAQPLNEVSKKWVFDVASRFIRFDALARQCYSNAVCQLKEPVSVFSLFGIPIITKVRYSELAPISDPAHYKQVSNMIPSMLSSEKADFLSARAICAEILSQIMAGQTNAINQDGSHDENATGTLTFTIKRPPRFTNIDADFKAQRDELLKTLKDLDTTLETAWRKGYLAHNVMSGAQVKEYKSVIAKCEGK